MFQFSVFIPQLDLNLSTESIEFWNLHWSELSRACEHNVIAIDVKLLDLEKQSIPTSLGRSDFPFQYKHMKQHTHHTLYTQTFMYLEGEKKCAFCLQPPHKIVLYKNRCIIDITIYRYFDILFVTSMILFLWQRCLVEKGFYFFSLRLCWVQTSANATMLKTSTMGTLKFIVGFTWVETLSMFVPSMLVSNWRHVPNVTV